MSQPNIFSYATSELSQDAFICWLLSWASPALKDSDKDLHDCAINLIKSFFDKHNTAVPLNIEKVDIRKQDKNIDVLCIINEIYPILIEDKTGTKNHSGQLSRYLNEIRGRKYEEHNILPIYFKTEDQSSYSNVVEYGYQPFLRADFLSILNTYKGTNAILVDYRSYLQSIADKVESYKFIDLSKWSWHSWIGFYLELQKQLGSGDWSYVANPAGGFLGFWWHFQGNEACKQYLQLEQDKLCFKIWVNTEDERRSLRSKWHQIINDKSRDVDLKFVKPTRFGNGEFMTVCVFDGEYRETEGGLLNMEKTIAQLKKAEHILKSVHGQFELE